MYATFVYYDEQMKLDTCIDLVSGDGEGLEDDDVERGRRDGLGETERLLDLLFLEESFDGERCRFFFFDFRGSFS